MLIGFITEDQQDFTSLAAGGHTNKFHAEVKKTLPDCDDIAGTSDTYEINSHLNQHSESTYYPVKKSTFLVLVPIVVRMMKMNALI